mmetsp:Transcript_8769/g.17096  ORF Transcript_8769/g.17096 Transcript_8769/m.17096 type:complete len:395 (-) Transcript_8769:259-1443(-)
MHEANSCFFQPNPTDAHDVVAIHHLPPVPFLVQEEENTKMLAAPWLGFPLLCLLVLYRPPDVDQGSVECIFVAVLDAASFSASPVGDSRGELEDVFLKLLDPLRFDLAQLLHDVVVLVRGLQHDGHVAQRHVPRPQTGLERLEEHRNAPEDHGVKDALPRQGISGRLEAERRSEGVVAVAGVDVLLGKRAVQAIVGLLALVVQAAAELDPRPVEAEGARREEGALLQARLHEQLIQLAAGHSAGDRGVGDGERPLGEDGLDGEDGDLLHVRRGAVADVGGAQPVGRHARAHDEMARGGRVVEVREGALARGMLRAAVVLGVAVVLVAVGRDEEQVGVLGRSHEASVALHLVEKDAPEVELSRRAALELLSVGEGKVHHRAEQALLFPLRFRREV